MPGAGRARIARTVGQATPLLACAVVLVAMAHALPAAEPEDERARIAAVTQPTQDFSKAEPYERRPAGAATVFKRLNRDAFSHPSANMPFKRQRDFRVGNGIFKKIWVSAPSSTTSSDGLGPLFNARACQRCHLKDGRGRPPAAGERAETMFLRLSIPPQTEAERAALREHRQTVIPEPTYGGQLQNFSIQGILAEGEMTIAYQESADHARRRRSRQPARTHLRRFRPALRAASSRRRCSRPASRRRSSAWVCSKPFRRSTTSSPVPTRTTATVTASPADANIVWSDESGSAHARPLRLEGRQPDRLAAGGSGVSRRCRHLDTSLSAPDTATARRLRRPARLRPTAAPRRGTRSSRAPLSSTCSSSTRAISACRRGATSAIRKCSRASGCSTTPTAPAVTSP